jgi:ribonuclease/clavin/mitogillin
VRQAVVAIFCYEDEVFTVTRNDFLKVFPGYLAFVGGKVDKADHDVESSCYELVKKQLTLPLWNALTRELREEVNIDLEQNFSTLVDSFYYLGHAITPDFNPYRFETRYYVIKLKEKLEFDVDLAEAKTWSWAKPQDLIAAFKQGVVLAVPPMVGILRSLIDQDNIREELDFSLTYNAVEDVPVIESVYGVRQFLPLSNTFPPANRTNSFLIGDTGLEVLIDPSPKDLGEAKKFLNTLKQYQVTKIFITHHHPDHHEHLRFFVEHYDVPVAMSLVTFELLKKKFGEDYLSGFALEIYQEGDVLTQSLGEDVLVYETPGHDAGQLGLAPTSMNWFIVSDLIQTVGTVLVAGDESDMVAYFNSLQRVIDCKPKVCFPSHGIGIGGTYKVEKTLKHRMQREKDILELHGQGKSFDEIVAILYTGIDEKLLVYAAATVHSHMIKLGL